MKKVNKTSKKRVAYITVAKGVYKNPATGNYIMRKQVDGKRMNFAFTNLSKAIKAYKSL